MTQDNESTIAFTTALQSAIRTYKKRSGMQSHYTIGVHRHRLDGASIGATRKWFDRAVRGDLPKSVVDLVTALDYLDFEIVIRRKTMTEVEELAYGQDVRVVLFEQDELLSVVAIKHDTGTIFCDGGWHQTKDEAVKGLSKAFGQMVEELPSWGEQQ